MSARPPPGQGEHRDRLIAPASHAAELPLQQEVWWTTSQRLGRITGGERPLSWARRHGARPRREQRDMTATTGTRATSTDREDELIRWADELGAAIAPFAGQHDRDGTFVTEAFDVLRSSGYLALPVPEELGGRGATIRETAMTQRHLARWCGSTALASSMHLHVTLFTAWRYRRQVPGAEATLRRIAAEGLVLVSTGGNDWMEPNGTAVRVDGGYRVNGRKVFASQAPVGDVMSTAFTHDDPAEGRRIIGMSVPVRAPGV